MQFKQDKMTDIETAERGLSGTGLIRHLSFIFPSKKKKGGGERRKFDTIANLRELFRSFFIAIILTELLHGISV